MTGLRLTSQQLQTDFQQNIPQSALDCLARLSSTLWTPVATKPRLPSEHALRGRLQSQ